MDGNAEIVEKIQREKDLEVMTIKTLLRRLIAKKKDNAMLSAFLIMIWTFTFRVVLVSFYFSLMYFIDLRIVARFPRRVG